MRTLIATVEIGHRTILCTDWPVVDQLHREQIGRRRPTWIVTRRLCNGVADHAETFRTKREAVAALLRT